MERETERLLKRLTEISSNENRTRNIVAEFHPVGQEAWLKAGARISFLTEGCGSLQVMVPKILAPAEKDNSEQATIIIVTQQHLEETSGPLSALFPEYWSKWRRLGFDLIIYFVNQYGLSTHEKGDHDLLREDEQGRNYNDGWGGVATNAPVEVMAVQKDIEQEHKKRRLSVALSTHEDSDVPGFGFAYACGVSVSQRLSFIEKVGEIHGGAHLATLLPQAEELYGGFVHDGAPFLIFGSLDPGCFEDWMSSLGVPTFVIEAPYGLDLTTRIQFQMDMVNSAISAITGA